jgi:hypothetical protein
MAFWNRPRRASLSALLVVATALTACAAPPPPAPTAETKPTAAPATAAPTTAPAASPAAPASPAAAASPTTAPAATAAASPAASPASSPAALSSPAAVASPPAVASPATVASPAAVATLPPAPPAPVVGASSAHGKITAVYTLPDTPIAAFQNARLPGSITNDRKMLLGGIGSDLWHQPGDPPDQFWMMTDRGPNGQVPVDLVQRRTFPIPEFTPTIMKVHVANGAIEITETVPIVGQSGKGVTGLSNIEGKDEAAYDFTAQTALPFNPSGMDTEGLVRMPSGEFWVAEENSPSLMRVGPTGKVVKRYVPEGLGLTGTDYPVEEALPAIYGKRKINRGFEGLALSPDQKTLFLITQSPLLNPDSTTGGLSRLNRILAFDIATEKPVAEYVYQYEAIPTFDLTANRPESEMKLSSAVAISADSLLILERTDWVAKIYRVDLQPATNILGTKWSDPATVPTLEASNNPAALGVTVLPKTLVIDLGEIENVPGKTEGLTVLDKNTLVIANDNDFDIGIFDGDGNNRGSGAKSYVITIALTDPLPIP